MGPVSNQTTKNATPVTFTLISRKNDTSAGVVYDIVDATSFSTPQQVTVSIDQSTGKVTLTPEAGFTGTLNFRAEVRANSAENDVQSNFDSLPFTLTVGPAAPRAGRRSLQQHRHVRRQRLRQHQHAQADRQRRIGATVKFKLSGTEIVTATETSPGSGIYTATVPSGKLSVGANSITAIVTNSFGTSVDSTAISGIYATTYTGGVYPVPGAPGTSKQLSFDWMERKPATTTNSDTSLSTRPMARSATLPRDRPATPSGAEQYFASSHLHERPVGRRSRTSTLQAGQMVVFI